MANTDKRRNYKVVCVFISGSWLIYLFGIKKINSLIFYKIKSETQKDLISGLLAFQTNG